MFKGIFFRRRRAPVVELSNDADRLVAAENIRDAEIELRSINRDISRIVQRAKKNGSRARPTF